MSRRLRQRFGRRRNVFVAGVAAAAVVAVPLAWASHRFADVPSEDQFHANIDALAGAGVTRGCNPPANTLYCPAEPVTRSQMAAFLHRGLGRVTHRALAVGSLPRGWTMVITPGLPSNALPGSANFVKVDATVTVVADTATGCPCIVEVNTTLDGQPITPEESYATVTSGGQVTIPITAGAKVTTAGQRNVGISVEVVQGTVTTGTARGNATVTVVPFGHAGTNELAPP